MNQALKDELARVLDGTTKGAPRATSAGVPPSTADVGAQHWNLLREDLPFPAAVIRLPALTNNLQWMQRYAAEHGVLLAPHGKTTMAPQLFHLQLQHGAWGITVATVHQLRVCRRFGIQRVFLANQLIGRQDIHCVRDELSRDPDFEFFCLVDSIEGVDRLEQVAAPETGNPINVLVEVGIPGGRCGCRTLEEAVAVVDAAAQSGTISLRGVECYEGIVASHRTVEDPNRIDAFFALFGLVYDYCLTHHRFDRSGPTILSAGGSAYFDIVARVLGDLADGDTHVLLRSGCYLTHDSGFYSRLGERFDVRSAEHGDAGMGLQPALEVWGQVQSVPESGLAIVNVGKRDISHDIDLPCVRSRFRPGAHEAPVEPEDGWTVNALNDQHAYLSVPAGAEVAVGDLIGFGISHPCTTFDKWRLIWLVDDDYQVAGAVWTYF